jgi:hypothetical protein
MNIVGTTPHLDGWRTLIVGVVLLPGGLIGLSLLIYRTPYRSEAIALGSGTIIPAPYLNLVTSAFLAVRFA